MICSQCGLSNLDQAKRCLRCNTLLDSQATEPAELTPPRATSRRRRQKLLMAWKRRRGFVWPSHPQRNAPSDGNDGFFQKSPTFRAAIAILCGFFLPSWRQFRLGRRRRGRALLCAAVLALFALVITLGTPYWQLSLWLLAIVQTWAMVDAMQDPQASIGRIICICLLSFFLFFAVSLADHMLTRRAITAIGWEMIPAYYQHGDLHAGMLVRVVPQDHYQSGDLVAARFGDYAALRFDDYAALRFDGYFNINIDGYYDRVIATGSHRVEIKERRVYIDGRPAKQQPLNREWMGMNWQPFTMRDNEILVYASWLHVYSDRIEIDRYPELQAVVKPNLPPGRVRGKVFIRWPVWRRQAMP